ncbi:MAG: hypothetical protein R3C05_07450 [Pirellulaceae bacterium]
MTTLQNEVILNVVPSQDENHRLVIAILKCDRSADRLVLRQETFSSDIGWFTQSTLPIEPEQLAGLTMTLTGGAVRNVRETQRSQPQSVASTEAVDVLSFREAREAMVCRVG